MIHNLRIAGLTAHSKDPTEVIILFFREKSTIQTLQRPTPRTFRSSFFFAPPLRPLCLSRKDRFGRVLSRRKLKGTHTGITADVTAVNGRFLSTNRKDRGLKELLVTERQTLSEHLQRWHPLT